VDVGALASLLDERRFGECREAALGLLRTGNLSDASRAEVCLALSCSLAALQSGQEALGPAELGVYFGRQAGEYDLVGRALCHLGALCHESGLYKRGIAALDEYFQYFGLYLFAKSLEGKVLSRLGLLYQAMGRGPRALEYFRRAYQWHAAGGASPQLVEVQRGHLIWQLLKLGETGQARELLGLSEAYLGRAPNDLEARACYLNNLGYCDYLDGKYPAAIDRCIQVLHMRNLPAAWKARACLTLHYTARAMGRVREAVGLGTLARIQASLAHQAYLEEEATRALLHVQQHEGLPLMDELLRSLQQQPYHALAAVSHP
jgi:tetratricopeptide (TPR) repeat protein